MHIIYEEQFKNSLYEILAYIAKDKPTAAENFQYTLKEKIEFVAKNPKICRASYYMDDERYRDLIFKGYTIIYKIEDKYLKVLDIFKWVGKTFYA